MTKHFSYVTRVGINKIEAAYNSGKTINLIEMAIGDSNGAYVEPDASFTALVNEFARVALNSASVDDHLIHVISYIKPTVETAEQTLREYGIYDDEGDMIIYGAYPESLIPSLDSAEHLQLEVENITELEHAEVVNVTVSPIVPYATETEAGIAKIIKEEDVEAGTDDSKILTIFKMLKRTASLIRAGVVQLSNKTDGTSETLAATEKAVGEAMATANAAQDALDDLKAEDNPFPQYLHNDEHATQAQAEEGASVGVWMSPLRTRQSFTAWLSQLVNGTSQTTGASEYALGLVNTKAENAQNTANSKWTAQDATDTQKGITMLSHKTDGTDKAKAASEYALGLLDDAVDDAIAEANSKLRWVMIDNGEIDYSLASGGGNFTKRGTIETSYRPPSWDHRSGYYYVLLETAGSFVTADLDVATWSAYATDPTDHTKWRSNVKPNWTEFDVYTSAKGYYTSDSSNPFTATLARWQLWELQSGSATKVAIKDGMKVLAVSDVHPSELEQRAEPILAYNYTSGLFTIIFSGDEDDIPQGSVLIDDDEAVRIQAEKTTDK
ncbi:phage tail protein [Vibrio parahaemolyticus]|uniref:phage tail protein n=1 Tax=Vibrio parahaemolyticus TaxID=670 RepID=UPI002F3ED4B2